jgi:hypothetical protein
MRSEPNLRIEAFRFCELGFESPPGVNWGAFTFALRGVRLRVISSGTDDEHGWEHVSVSVHNRCPTWQEMQYVKELFWRDDECVVQFHPPSKTYVNCHPHCLHMWRPLNQDIPQPPLELIGPIAVREDHDDQS